MSTWRANQDLAKRGREWVIFISLLGVVSIVCLVLFLAGILAGWAYVASVVVFMIAVVRALNDTLGRWQL